ncbi:S8 family serine peptidase [Streptomyces lydicus]|nr:S8 family serine peptidase [Streptomyces lydicus]
MRGTDTRARRRRPGRRRHPHGGRPGSRCHLRRAGGGHRQDELTAAVAHAAERGALVVAPAVPDNLPKDGNTGKPAEPAPWYWPASAPGVLSVMDYGPDGQRPQDAPRALNADLAAPGDAVVSVGPQGDGHYFGSGSSLAAARVAGAAALVRARHPKMTAQEVARQLTVAGYPDDPPRLDPYAALTTLLTDKQGAAPRQAAAHVPEAAPSGPQNRALLIAGACGGLVLLVAGGAVVIPRGRARAGGRPGARGRATGHRKRPGHVGTPPRRAGAVADRVPAGVPAARGNRPRPPVRCRARASFPFAPGPSSWVRSDLVLDMS